MKLNNLFAFFFLIFLCSCDKKGLDKEESFSTLKIGQISVQDFESAINDESELKSATIPKSKNSDSTLYPESKMVYMTPFDALVDVSGEDGSNPFSNLKKNAADVPITNDIKFRLLIYKASDLVTPIVNQALTITDNPDINIAGNTNYKWFAYSTNESTVPDIDALGVIDKEDLQNKDFMYASGNLSAVPGDNYLKIIFKRQVSRIIVDLNTRGMFGEITDDSKISVGTTVNTSIIQAGDFSVISGIFTNLSEIETEVAASEMSIANSNWGNAEKLATFYSAENSDRIFSANTLNLRLITLSIKLDDDAIRTFAETIVPIRNSSSVSLSKGRSATMNVRLIESGVLVNGLYWARTNLIYDATKLYAPFSNSNPSTSDAYRFKPNNEYTIPPVSEYWNQGSSTPAGTDYNSVDVCTRVYPYGTWHKPSGTEFNELIANTTPTRRKENVNGSVRYALEWASSQPANPAYTYNNLLLVFYGYRNASGTVVQLPNGTNTADGEMHYSARNYVSGTGAGRSLTGTVSNGVISLTLANTTLPNTNGQSVRCVRQLTN